MIRGRPRTGARRRTSVIPSFQSRGTTSTDTVNTTSTTIAVPSGVVANDIVIAHFYVESTTAWSAPPAGWTEITWPTHATTSPTMRLRTFWRRATGAESGTYTFAHPSMYALGFAARYSGAITTGTPFLVLSAAGNTGAPSTTTPVVSGTTTSNNSLLVFFSTSYSNGVWTPPSAFSSHYNPGASEWFMLATKVQPIAGATGNITATRTGTASLAVASLLALIPA